MNVLRKARRRLSIDESCVTARREVRRRRCSGEDARRGSAPLGGGFNRSSRGCISIRDVKFFRLRELRQPGCLSSPRRRSVRAGAGRHTTGPAAIRMKNDKKNSISFFHKDESLTVPRLWSLHDSRQRHWCARPSIRFFYSSHRSSVCIERRSSKSPCSNRNRRHLLWFCV